MSDKQKMENLHQLTQQTKETLQNGNIFRLSAAKNLYEIKRDNLHKDWDSSRDVTWGEYIANADYPMSVSVANKWIRIYREYLSEGDYEAKDIADVDYSKLLLLLREDAKDELTMARNLSYSDLRDELKDEEPCLHQEREKVIKIKCKNCNKILHKHKEKVEEDDY